jgi:hypothetical protein
MTMLGFVATKRRTLASGQQYNRHFDLSGVQGNEVTLIDNGTVEQTVAEMKKIVSKYGHQVHKLAPVLKGNTRLETARNIWNFVYNHIQYKRDNPLREQIRTPLRTWRDRSTGVDCDCYSVFISALLSSPAIGLPHAFRIAAYAQDFQHVYVIVPTKGNDYSQYITIDCVADSFNYEVPYSKKKDFTVMGSSTTLNGLGNAACRKAQPTVVYMDAETLSKRGYVFTADVLRQLNIPFTEIISDNGNVPQVHATVGGRVTVLPTAIKRDQIQTLKQNISKALPSQTSGLAGLSPKKAWWVVGAAALAWLFSGDDNTPAVAGLGSAEKANKLPFINL